MAVDIGSGYADQMDLDLTPEQEELIRRAIESGRIARREDALNEAVEIWAKIEQIRDDLSLVFEKFRRTDLVDEKNRATINSLFHLALGAASIEIDDDPFMTFDEWSSDADRKAYGDL